MSGLRGTFRHSDVLAGTPHSSRFAPDGLRRGRALHLELFTKPSEYGLFTTPSLLMAENIEKTTPYVNLRPCFGSSWFKLLAKYVDRTTELPKLLFREVSALSFLRFHVSAGLLPESRPSLLGEGLKGHPF